MDVADTNSTAAAAPCDVASTAQPAQPDEEAVVPSPIGQKSASVDLPKPKETVQNEVICFDLLIF